MDAYVDDQEYYEVIKSTGSTIGIDHDFSLIFDRALRYPETSDYGSCSYIEYDSNDEQKNRSHSCAYVLYTRRKIAG